MSVLMHRQLSILFQGSRFGFWINEVVKIHEEGSKKCIEAQEELARIENELKQALLEAGEK